MPFKTKNIDLSPKLKLGIGRKPSQFKILKFTCLLLLFLTVLIGLQAFVIFINKAPLTKAEDAGKVLGTSELEDRFIEVTVTKLDTLYGLSQTYDVPWTTIAEINNLTAPFMLKENQKLLVPKK
ncbi:MAG TPA: LysM domain-containing protein [Patescibacteria group bacterium]|nr:LysM domain-containing protein [Patescibacteria group bacterium]